MQKHIVHFAAKMMCIKGKREERANNMESIALARTFSVADYVISKTLDIEIEKL